MRLVRRATLPLALCALALAPPAVGQQEPERAFKQRGAYRITVSGTATLELQATTRATCADVENAGSAGVNNVLVSGSYRVTLQRKTTKIPRVATGYGTYTPWGTVKGFSLTKSAQETFDEFTCDDRPTPVTKTCTTTRATPSRASLQFGADSAKRLIVKMRGEGPSGFPGFFYCHDTRGTFEYFGGTLFSFDRLSRWKRSKGSLVLSYDKPLTLPKNNARLSAYTGKTSARLKIAWRRVRR